MNRLKFLLYFLTAAFLMGSSCKKESEDSQEVDPPEYPEYPDDPEEGTLPPVETQKPNSDYTPAFKGQTRIGGLATVTAYDFSILTNGLSSPWGIAQMPDGRFLITERAGTMRIATSTGELSPQITGFPSVDSRNQGGLLDVAPSPDFATSRLIFFTLAESGSVTAVGKGRLSNDESKIENFQIIWRALPYYDNSYHFGSRIVFDSKGNLFVSTGDRSSAELRPNTQKLSVAYGKVVHITTSGKAVAGNPFESVKDALPEVYSLGHRNPQGLAIHPVSGDLWLSEMGPLGGDEINRIEAGKNYGWPTITYGLEYSGAKIGQGITQKAGMEQPVYYWDPVVSPSGITFYSSGLIPEWKNNLFAGCLSGQHILRLVISKNNRVIGEERLLANQGQRFRDLCEGSDGALYAVTDAGRLYKIFKK